MVDSRVQSPWQKMEHLDIPAGKNAIENYYDHVQGVNLKSPHSQIREN